MAQIRNKFDIQDTMSYEKLGSTKALPTYLEFDNKDEINPLAGLLYSLLIHMLLIFIAVVVAIIQSLVFPFLPKPELPNRNIEFKLVQNESKPPINKNTKIRSDRDSQAGGKHDPKKAISEPSKPASVPVKKSVAQKPNQTNIKPQPQKNIQKPVEKAIAKQPQKTTQPSVEQVQKPIAKPTPIKPTSVKPALKPVAKPQTAVIPSAPKIVSAPKSPFKVEVPTSQGPVGTTYKPAITGAQTNTQSDSPQNVAPVPKFSATGSSNNTSTSSSNGGQYASRGSYGGYGSGGNPSPGNPSGAPGIDALRQPNWGPYMKNLEQKIKRNWNPPKGDSSKRVVITFTIGKDGRLLSSRITKSSGVPLADRAALSAIELTAPFAPLPPEFKGQSVPIEFTFDYNVINSVLR